jgi:moderate conductance mechanosensitive channel
MIPAAVQLLDRAEPALFAVDWRILLAALLPDLLRVVVIIALALVARRLLRLLSRRITERPVDEDDPLVRRVREQRAQTLASLLNNIGAIVIVSLAVLTVLGTFIDIRPLLAGAGIIGLAISFGAQSLVKDVISGSFILMEGQFGIGDVVRIGDTGGLVEKITLRTTILRDNQGVVHVIPNGEITRLSNMTKAWSRAVLDIGIAYKEDVDRVMAVLRSIGEDLEADPDWGPLLLETPQVPGVEGFADSAVTVRMVAKTLPLKQWDVARELRRRIKNRFDAEGIELPFPHVTFYWGEGQSLPAAGPRAASDGDHAGQALSRTTADRDP